MSKQVDFYLIQNQINDAKFKLASRLSNKLLKLKKKTLIVTDSVEESSQLDQILWSFSGTSFVAHEDVTESMLHNSLVHIGTTESVNNETLDNGYDVLINLCQSTPVFIHHFERIAEIVEQQGDHKTAGRLRYKNYQQEGFEIKTHSLEL